MDISTPTYVERRSRETALETIITLPDTTPAQPIPATALPTMNILLFRLAAQTREPIMKSSTTNKKTFLAPKIWYAFPHIG